MSVAAQAQVTRTLGGGICGIMHAPALAAESLTWRKKTSADKRRVRGPASKWRKGTGASKVVRSDAWRMTSDETSWEFWVKVFQHRNPQAVVTGSAVRKLITELLLEPSFPVGPPTAEFWTPIYYQEDNVTVRQLNKVVHQQFLRGVEEVGEPYVSSRSMSPCEWKGPYSGEQTNENYDVLAPIFLRVNSLDECSSPQRRGG